MEVPAPHFLIGRWTLESRDNVDAFLYARGLSWIIRKFALSFQADLEYAESEQPGHVIKKTHSYMGVREETLPFPGSYEPARTLSGKPEVGVVYFEGSDCVVQEMKCKETGDVLARIERRVIEGKLYVTLTCGDVIAHEVYSKMT